MKTKAIGMEFEGNLEVMEGKEDSFLRELEELLKKYGGDDWYFEFK